MILDEATSNCDVDSEGALYDMIDSHLKEKTVILITHKHSHLKRLDRVFELSGGRLRQLGADEIDKLTS
jgi:ABC-type transport system involved in cytochrome bd biosynthesis fused ATPase/permease subunit